MTTFSPNTDINAQITAFFSSGGKKQELPHGATSNPHESMKDIGSYTYRQRIAKEAEGRVRAKRAK